MENHYQWVMVDFLIGHYTYRMFPTAIDIISTSLAVAYSDEKYTYQNWSITTWHTLQPRQYFLLPMTCHGNKNLRAHQREVEEWPVATFCKYNVLLGNLPLYYRMFPPAIDRIPKLRPGMGVQIWKKLIMEADFWYFTWWKASRKLI